MKQKPIVGIDLKKLRKAIEAKLANHGLSYRRAATEIGISYGTLHHFVSAYVNEISLMNFERLLHWLELPRQEFLLGPASAVPPASLTQPLLFHARVSAGRGELVLDNSGEPFDLHEDLVGPRQKAPTYIVQVEGDSMIGEGIFNGDLLVVEATETARPGEIVIATVNGGSYVKKLVKAGPGYVLRSANQGYADIPFQPGEKAIQGRVTHAIHKFR